MKKVSNWLWFLPAAVLLAFSVLCWYNMIGEFADGSVTLQLKKPTPFLQRVDKHIDTIGNAWDDAINWKSDLSQYDAVATYLATRRISSTQVVRGQDGWLFYMTTSDGNTIADFEGNGRFPQEAIDSIVADAQAAQAYLSAQGVQFAVLVPPNKENLFAELVPDSYAHGKHSRTDLLIKAMKKGQVPIVDPSKKLREVKALCQPYYRYDTHWNLLGGYVGTQAVLSHWGIELPELSDCTILSPAAPAPNDLAQMLKMSDFFSDDTDYMVEGLPAVTWDSGTADNCVYTNPDAMLPDATLLLVGDSFRIAMIPTLRSIFGHVHVIHWAAFGKGAADQFHPDYLIAESVERYSGTLGDKMKLLIPD